MKDKFLKLISVKTIITLVATGLFVYTTVKGITDGEFFKTIYTMIISFYFGMKLGEESKK